MNPAFGSNVFTILTLIAAPAVLTNASSVLALNTANRFGRVVDRSRVVALELERGELAEDVRALRMRQLGRLSKRATLLLSAQTCVYGALALFVIAALISVIGAALHDTAITVAAILSLVSGTTATVLLSTGCVQIIRETRLAMTSLQEEAALLDERSRRI